MKKYNVAIASNFLNHYQYALSMELKKYCDNFYYVVSEQLEQEYKNLGFSDLNDNEFVIKAYEDKQRAEKVLYDCDVVITGSYKYRDHIQNRIKNNKIVFYYSERLFKSKNIVGTILRYIKYWTLYHNDLRSPLLCVSAYAAGDYNQIGVFKDRTYKWGYFPKVNIHNVDNLIEKKNENSIFWAGRFVNWKHPDKAILLAKRLKEDGYSFKLNIAGTGKMNDELRLMVEENDLSDVINMMGSLPTDEVRKQMESSDIYLFTSDYGEGWGVVLLEAMNSACAVVANKAAGSVPFLIDDGRNGYIYENGDYESLYRNVKSLLDDKKKADEIRKNAYQSIINDWNPEIAASRLYEMIDYYMNDKADEFYYEKGILSKAIAIDE